MSIALEASLLLAKGKAAKVRVGSDSLNHHVQRVLLPNRIGYLHEEIDRIYECLRYSIGKGKRYDGKLDDRYEEVTECSLQN